MNFNISFSKQLIYWYLEKKRNLPWRETKIPYQIWISEVILQQTRVEQGKPYFFRFIERFPDVETLAAAGEQEVLKYWEGLGYYSRARNLHFASKQIIADFGGRFPDNYTDILKLKGVGEYTAAAIASIAFNEPIPAIDGNVYRVLSRLFAEDTPIDGSAGKTRFKLLAKSIFDENKPATFNQAMMELGALQCTPKNPDCELCPGFSFCEAAQKGIQNQFPVKKPKNKVSERYLYYIYSTVNDKIAVQKRQAKDIWQNLYEFPLIETTQTLYLEELEVKIADFLNKESKIIKIYPEIVNLLSHRRLHVNFIKVETQAKELQYISLKEIKKLPFPMVIKRFLENV